MALDITYFEIGYIDETYFVRTADAVSTEPVVSTISITANVIRGVSAAITARFTVTANDYAKRFIELHAFSNAQLTAQAKRIKQFNIAVSSVFTVAVNAKKSVYILSQEQSAFAMSTNNNRRRGIQAAPSAAFSVTSDALEIILPGTRTRITIVGDING
jgi:hypothetical protein